MNWYFDTRSPFDRLAEVFTFDALNFNCKESDSAYTLSIPLPGVARDNVALSLAGDKLTVEYSGKKQVYTVFVDKIDVDAIFATMENGLLQVVFPKKVPQARKIEIK